MIADFRRDEIRQLPTVGNDPPVDNLELSVHHDEQIHVQVLVGDGLQIAFDILGIAGFHKTIGVVPVRPIVAGIIQKGDLLVEGIFNLLDVQVSIIFFLLFEVIS